MALFKDKTIEKRVMAVVSEAIATSQAAYEADVEAEEVELEAAIERIHEAHEEKRSALAATHVQNVLSKLRP